MVERKTPLVCKSCGGDGPQGVYNYCRECVAKHARGELALGGCKGCDILADAEARNKEELGVE